MRKLIATISIAVVLGSAAPPAYAYREKNSGPHPAIIAVAAVFGVGALLGLITWLSRRSAPKTTPTPLMPMTSPVNGQQPHDPVRYGLQCSQTDPKNLTLACW